MSRTARKSVATKELLRQVAKRATGRLTVASAEGALVVYLMAGDIIGATSPSDDLQLLRRVRLAGAVPPAVLAPLERAASGGEPIFGPLLDAVPPDAMEAILFDRFRDNLVAFLAQEEQPYFEALSAVFVDNMQMGQNAARLIDSACKDADLAQRAPLDLRVVRGSTRGRDEVEQGVVDRLGRAPTPVAAVLAEVPVDLWLGRAIMASLLDSGAARPVVGLEASPVSIDEDTSDAPTEQTPPRPEPVVVPEPDGAPEPADAEPEPASLEDEPTAGALDDEPTGDPPAVDRVGGPDDLARWLDTGDHLSEEDLAFFEDHEDDRGAGGGGFSTDQHNLDKVDVGPPQRGAPPPEEEAIEAEEVPAARFSAPVLAEEDALDKIAVCNDVLRKVCAAMDAHEGPGRGRALVQLLVEGSDSRFTALLHDLNISDEGELDPEEVLGNLAGRPPTEHRQLMNSALKSVIERALSSAADELPEDAFDDLYESVAGYNQRLGL